MARLTADEYVDSSKVILENEARNTVQNFLYGFEIIARLFQGPTIVRIVTSDYHAARTFYVAHSVLKSMDLPRFKLEIISAFTHDEVYRNEKFTGEFEKLPSTVGYLLKKYQLKPLPQNYFLTALSMMEKK
ncbi:Oidioi.mRNA.OKI2018_I69.XSR.g14031.t1.cds [Oikopleura dioica]|uniref:Oidioi.mRNA.OKI2018_I69.XSR.g14031.t1.cds n=1 Tax=Oikopleura dioica TaxID=34765 RepID=A0ABN7S8S4_OIKDI|nr:Oidioi.mRNA.OKI2018_I69.XSR.g14031.t1.cds [Oikopleura dioica]